MGSRVEPNGLVKVGDRLIVCPLVAPYVASVDAHNRITGIKPNGLAEVGDRLVVCLHPTPEDASAAESSGGLRG